MKQENAMTSKFDILVSELCEEIDHWKASAKHWKEMYENERDAFNKQTNERLEESKRGIANALLLCLSVRDNPDGSLSIRKEERQHLAESINPK